MFKQVFLYFIYLSLVCKCKLMFPASKLEVCYTSDIHFLSPASINQTDVTFSLMFSLFFFKYHDSHLYWESACWRLKIYSWEESDIGYLMIRSQSMHYKNVKKKKREKSHAFLIPSQALHSWLTFWWTVGFSTASILINLSRPGALTSFFKQSNDWHLRRSDVQTVRSRSFCAPPMY